MDDAGNIKRSEESVYKSSGTLESKVVAQASYPDPASSSVSCKNCTLEAWAQDGSGVELSHRWYRYDAPLGTTVALAAGQVTAGHLNSIDHLVAAGVTSTDAATAYNADGTVAYTQRDFAAAYSESGQAFSVREEFTWDASGTRLTKQVRAHCTAGGANCSGGTRLVVDRTYDGVGNLITEVGPYVQGQAADPITSTVYDEFSRPTWVARTDWRGTYPIVHYEYSAASATEQGWVRSYTFATQFAWPFTASLQRDDVKLSTTYFDSLGRPTQTRLRLGGGSGADASAQIVQSLASNRVLVTGAVKYDAAGRVVARYDPYYSSLLTAADFTQGGDVWPALPHVTTVSYDEQSRPVCEVYQPLGAAPLPSCNSNGVSLARGFSYGTEILNGSTYASVTRTLDYHTAATTSHPRELYSASGRQVRSYAADGTWTSAAYDALGRVTGTTRASADGAVTIGATTEYDLLGRVTLQWDASAGWKNFYYLPTGELREVRINEGRLSAGEARSRRYKFGSLGRVAWLTDEVSGPQPSTVEHHWGYDQAEIAGLAYTAGRAIGYASFSEGAWVTSRNFGYDSAGRTVTEYGFIAGLNVTAYLSGEFRPDGRPLSWIAGSAAMSHAGSNADPNCYRKARYEYDSAGGLVQARQVELEDRVLWKAMGGTAETGAYDALGRLTSVHKDLVGSEGRIREAYGFHQDTNMPQTSAITIGGNGAEPFTENTYTYFGSKLTQHDDVAAQTRWTYVYGLPGDGDGRLTDALASSIGAPRQSARPQAFTETYAFNGGTTPRPWNLAQVTATQAGGGGQATQAYTYTTEIGPNGPAPTERMATLGADSFATDKQGNVITRTSGQMALGLKYDAGNRLTEVSKGGVVQERLRYDAQGAITIREFPAGSAANPNGTGFGEERRIYLHEDMTFIKHANGSMDAVFHFRIAGKTVAEFWSVGGAADGLTYLHRDRLGSVIATSAAGALAPATQWRYRPYGEVDVGPTGATELALPLGEQSERGYTDALKLSEGLLFMRARVYDPAQRRFVQADNVDLKRYTYTDGDPVNHTDPSGHMKSHLVFPTFGLSALEHLGGYSPFIDGAASNPAGFGSWQFASGGVVSCVNHANAACSDTGLAGQLGLGPYPDGGGAWIWISFSDATGAGSQSYLTRELTHFEKNLILDSLHAMNLDSPVFNVDALCVVAKVPRTPKAAGSFSAPGSLNLRPNLYAALPLLEQKALRALVHEAAHAYDYQVNYLSNEGLMNASWAEYSSEYFRLSGKAPGHSDRPWEEFASAVEAMAVYLLGRDDLVYESWEGP